MNRNTESYFSQMPSVNIGRSIFDRSFTHKTSFNAGLLIPLMVEEVIPGSTYQLKTSFLIRSQTPIRPVMDDAYLDVYHFFVPCRLVWKHWEEFMGANKSGPWVQQPTYTVPQVTAINANSMFQENSVADYMGIPCRLAAPSLKVNALPFRCYSLIWNEYFRDENIDNFAAFYEDDTTRATPLFADRGAIMNATYQQRLQSAVLGGAPLPVNRFHDYFSSCFPQPQKAPDARGIAAVDFGGVPVVTSPTENVDALGTSALKWRGITSSHTAPSGGAIGNNSNSGTYVGGTAPSTTAYVQPSNLVVGNGAFVSINDLRFAFQLQKFYERQMMFGSRYTEFLFGMYGTRNPDYRLQRPEYLGGSRKRISQNQVVQTSSTDSVTPQGNTAAYSLTTDSKGSFIHSFTEHGYILTLGCVRHSRSYQQGLNKMWSRKDQLDFYNPLFSHIGYQPVYKRELYVGTNDDQVFGYQEAWADYRYKPAQVTGAMRSVYASGTLDSWHYGDYYTAAPTLSEDWLAEGKQEIDRTLAISSDLTDQFFGDFLFDMKVTAPMPVYSVPGFADHF